MADFTEPTPVSQETAVPKIQQFNEFSVGAGSTIFKANKEGVFLGGTNYIDANLSFSYDGKITAKNNSSISSVILDGTTGRIQFKYNGTQGGTIWNDSALNMVYWANTKHFFQNIDGTVGFAEIGPDGLLLGAATSIFFASGSTLTDTGATLALDRTLTVTGDVSLSAGHKFQVGSTGGVSFSHANIGGLFAITSVGGIITSFTKF